MTTIAATLLPTVFETRLLDLLCKRFSMEAPRFVVIYTVSVNISGLARVVVSNDAGVFVATPGDGASRHR